MFKRDPITSVNSKKRAGTKRAANIVRASNKELEFINKIGLSREEQSTLDKAHYQKNLKPRARAHEIRAWRRK